MLREQIHRLTNHREQVFAYRQASHTIMCNPCSKLDPIGRLNGFFYATIGEIFEREFVDGQPR